MDATQSILRPVSRELASAGRAAPAITERDIHSLRERMTGDVVIPGDEAWDAARQAWNLAVDQHPIAVALPENPQDVAEVVALAYEAGLQVAPQRTGHNASALGSLENTILLKTYRMRGVSVDPAARTARAEAGVIWIEVVQAAAEHGLAALAGSSPDVGVVGYTLGGGLSLLARKHGIGANRVTAIEVVTADGAFRRVDRDNDADLFWALRGGGGAFGVVTAIESICSRSPKSTRASSGSRSSGRARCSRRGVGGRTRSPTS